MSLNGLDDVKVKEAHDTAVAEPGGWFLLKYVARDEIELLGRGNGGIVEIRNAIASYGEPSPLFGFLRYRRRNVLIKYVPDDCSRLVQARVTVHFNAVTERFSPHDTVFPITTSKDLRDTTLSAACSLHTASGSTSSSTSSLRRRRLMEIAEDNEEENRTKRQSTVPEETRPSTAKTLPVPAPQSTEPTSPLQDPTPSLPNLTDRLPISSNLETSPPPPRERASVDESRPRLSSQSTRPNLFSYTTYGSNGKPKVKLGPRPSLDVGGKRPHTSGAASLYRPVSTLPAGLKLFSRGSRKGKDKDKARPMSHHPIEAQAMSLSPPSDEGPMPQLASSRPHTSGGRPNTSSGASIKPLASPTASNTPKVPAITPEKARLMKALQLRKKQMSKPTTTESLPAASETLTTAATKSEKSKSMGAPKDVQDTLAMLDDMASNNDSGIAFDAGSANKTDESDATRSDSPPTSPIGLSSKAESTPASSVSDSTDETPHPANSSKEDAASGDNVVNGSEETLMEISTVVEEVDEEVEDKAPVDGSIPDADTEPTLVTKGEEKEIPEQATAELPLLQASTYEAPPFSVSVPVPDHQKDKPVAEEISEVVTSSATVIDTEKVVEPPPEVEAVHDSQEAASSSNTTVDSQAKETSKESEDTPSAPVPAVKVEARELKIPRSKFSMPDLKAANNVPSITTEPLPVSNGQAKSPADSIRSKFSTRDIHVGAAVTTKPLPTSESQDTLKPNSSVGSTSSRAEVDDTSNTHTKRRGLIEPIRTDLEASDRSGATSEANFSSDDDLMDELQSAVLQDAQPISVSKSPISPVFPSPSKKEGNRFSRAFSNPLGWKDSSKSDLLSAPETAQPSTSRSVSAGAAFLNRISQQPSAPIAKKVNLGSGISQRIKALEQLSSVAPGSSPAPGTSGPPPGSSQAFFSVRKSVVRPVSRSPSIAERADSLTKNSPDNSRESSPEAFKLRNRSGSVQNRLDAFQTTPVPSSPQPSRSRPESISVTARIIRDPSQPFPQKSEAGKDPLDYAPLDLKQSPLVIDHQKSSVTPPKETIRERRQSKEKEKDRRSSITVVKDFINEKRNSFSEGRRSINLEPAAPISRVKSPSRPPSVHASPGFHRPLSVRSNKSVSSVVATSPPPTAGSSSSVEEKSEKKSNRASRMLRRMSSSLSNGRKNVTRAISPTVREDPEPVPHDIDTRSITSSYPSQTPMTPTLSDVGDVNVQFPDTLLWKRRSMGLDSQGFLVLAPALTAHKAGDKATTRRFHLSEFRTPSIPEMEMQELPNSVVLDFFDGSGLQIACEDRAGQSRVLTVLKDAHRAWAGQ